MDKNISLSIALFVVAILLATVTSFDGDENDVGGFGGGDYFNRKYQSWLDKRSLGLPSSAGFGRPFGDEARYFNWKNYLANSISKRQLQYGPRSFGNFQRYFSNGLQDWKNTYTGLKKREVPQPQEP